MPAKLKVLTSGEPARQPSRKLGQGRRVMKGVIYQLPFLAHL